MSFNRGLEYETKETKSGVGKRELMKMDREVKMIENHSNEQIRHPKRTAPSNSCITHPPQRKLTKLDECDFPPQQEQIMSSPIHNCEAPSTTPPSHPQNVSQDSHHLNPLYPLPQETDSIINFLLCANYAAQEKMFEKQSQDWTIFDQSTTPTVTIVTKEQSNKVLKALEQKIKKVKGGFGGPFGSKHVEFIKKYENEKELFK